MSSQGLDFNGVVGEALRLVREEEVLPHEAIPRALDRLRDPQEQAEAAKAGVEARVYQILERDKAREEARKRREQRERAAEAGEAKCLRGDCDAGVLRIERYKTTVVWSKQEDGSWHCGHTGQGTHFHLFCTAGHETRCWGRRLPETLKKVIY